MTYPGDTTKGPGMHEWRTSKVARFASCTAIVCGIGGLIALIVVSGMRGEPLYVLLLAPLVLLAQIWIWRIGIHPRISATPSALIIVNPLGRQALDWAAITGVKPGYDGMVISTTYGEFRAWAVQKSNVAKWLGRHTRADSICQELLAQANAKRAGATKDDSPFPPESGPSRPRGRG
jgi:hypothetical protein